ncbi:hypothetical protein LOK49_LG10G01953 [Camellia lanceoleosa]|uniref:Uncharacterized protein n=1 Tax=Camellia lanceoleosa TaxID=1840588 RepID=A0ACC0GBM0_9ERIC|nr:hypothetical protein LOK49_LG10G01953 [Camellia lanceoleosa]
MMEIAKAMAIEEGMVKASQVTDRNLQRVCGVQSWREWGERTFSPNFFPRKCLAAEETVAAAVAASAATAVEDATYTLRDVRWVWELRMVANVEPTAAVTLALANEQMTTS